MLVEFEYVGLDRPPDYEFVGLVNAKDWRAKETLEEAVKKKELMKNGIKNRYSNPRTNYVNDGQGIGTNYSRFIERISLIYPVPVGSIYFKPNRLFIDIKT